MSKKTKQQELVEKQQKEQQEEAERLVKVTDKVFDLLVKEKVSEMWQFKTVHSMLAQRVQGSLDKIKLEDLI